MTNEEMKTKAEAVAQELEKASRTADPGTTSPGGGSRHRGLPDDLRSRFIEIRTALVQRGVVNPLLARFDTATGTQASTREVAEELAKVAAAL